MIAFQHWKYSKMTVCSLELCIHIFGHGRPAPEMHESVVYGTQAEVQGVPHSEPLNGVNL